MSSRQRGTRTLLRLSSADRDNATTTTTDNCRWTLSRQFSAFSMQPISFSIPNSSYNVVTAVNDRLDTSLGTVTVAQGIYTPTTLAAAVQTVLQVVNAGFTCTYSTLTLKFTIAIGIGATFQFATGANILRSLHLTMGFASADTATTSLTAANASLLSSPEAVLVRSQALSAGAPPALAPLSGAATKYGDCIARVPLSGSPGSGYTQWSATLDFEDINYPSTGTLISAIDLKFFDADTNLPVLLNGVDWSCEISFLVNEQKSHSGY